MANEFDVMFNGGNKLFAEFGQVYIPSGGGTDNYNKLKNRPAVEGNILEGDKTFIELGLLEITPQEIDDIFDELIYGGL